MSAPDRRRQLDEVAAAAIAGSGAVLVDGWLCRADGELPFRRANAALPPLGASTAPAVAETIDAVAAWYRSRTRAPRVQVSTADPSWQDLDDLLADRGFVVDAPVTVLTARIGGVVSAPEGVVVERRTGVSERWARAVAALHGDDLRGRARTEAYGRTLAAFGDDGLAVSVVVDGEPVAVGFGVRNGNWCGVFGMATAPAVRRRGVARQLLAELSALAADRGATHRYLQLEDDNPAADALYRGAGFEPSHRYHYRLLQEP